MPNSSNNQQNRRQALRRILQTDPAGTQQFLVTKLTELGFEATQSSVSRDLKDIAAVKTADGYILASQTTGAEDEMSQVADLLRYIKPAGPNLLVIRTAIGAAQRVALALDRCGWPEIVGNVGGDDTVFTATPGSSAQRQLINKIERVAARA